MPSFLVDYMVSMSKDQKDENGSVDLEVARTRTAGTIRTEVSQHPFGEDKAIQLSPGVGHGLGNPVSTYDLRGST